MYLKVIGQFYPDAIGYTSAPMHNIAVNYALIIPNWVSWVYSVMNYMQLLPFIL